MAVVLDPWATYGRQTDIKTLLEIMAGGFRYLRTIDGTGTLVDHTEQHLSLEAADTTITLPSVTATAPAEPDIPEGRIGDLVLCVTNDYAPEVEGTPTPSEATISLDAGLDSTYKIATIDGESISDILTFDAGAKAILYFTLSAFTDSDLPVWIVTRHDVEVVEPQAQSNEP